MYSAMEQKSSELTEQSGNPVVVLRWLYGGGDREMIGPQ